MSEPWTVGIPKDPAKRAALAEMAGLTDAERLAIDQWCDLMAREDEAKRRRGLESVGDALLATDEAPAPPPATPESEAEK